MINRDPPLGLSDALQGEVSAEGLESVPERGKEEAEGGSGRSEGLHVIVGHHRLPEPTHRQWPVWADTYLPRGGPAAPATWWAWLMEGKDFSGLPSGSGWPR